ncbi:hypothetical protein Pfo_005224 [Paulownia fortunei]|nr:hypothetical protein Pfo_005224 [Paulownia fortunei]
MSNLTKLEFIALDIFGNNYLAWTLDAEIHLDVMNLGETIKEENAASLQDRAKVMIFLRHHLHEKLKTEYLIVKNPYVFWKNLKEMYDHQKTIILLKARYDWMHLRLQDFKSVSQYNSTIFKITSQLKLCGESITDKDMLKKIFSIFHASNMLLQQQYRERGFKKYSELISCLLVAGQNNKLLMKNHQSRPTGSKSFSKVNAAIINNFGRSRTVPHHQKWENNGPKQEENGLQNKTLKTNKSNCHRCGMKRHWRRTCRTSKHLTDLYQASLKEKGKGEETNLIEHYTPMNFTQLDVTDFFENSNGNFENLNGDGNINMI